MSYAVNGMGVADLSWMPGWLNPGSSVTPIDPGSSVLPPDPEPVEHLQATMPRTAGQSEQADEGETEGDAETPRVITPVKRATVVRSLVGPATIQVQPTSMGRYAGWAAIAILGGVGATLIWKATSHA